MNRGTGTLCLLRIILFRITPPALPTDAINASSTWSSGPLSEYTNLTKVQNYESVSEKSTWSPQFNLPIVETTALALDFQVDFSFFLRYQA